MNTRRTRINKTRTALLALSGVLLCAVLLLVAYRAGEKKGVENAEQTQPTPVATPDLPVFVQPTPPPTPAPTRQLQPEVTGEPDYAFFWVTDTQHYASKYPDTFYTMLEWMRDNIETYDIEYVFFTGDFVHNYDNMAQWTIADEAMGMLDGVVPYFALAGNHDVGTNRMEYDNYLSYFGKSRFRDNPHVDSWFEQGKGRCDVFSIGGTDYVFVGLGYGMDTAKGIRWMNECLKKYPAHNAILLLHDYMTTAGTLSKTGERIFEEVVKPNQNVFMVLCGHRYNCTLLTLDVNDDGTYLNYRRVYNVMMNFQAFENGGDGYLALIRVYEKEKVFTIDTYSPTLDQWYRIDPARSVNKERLMLPVTIFDPPAPTPELPDA